MTLSMWQPEAGLVSAGWCISLDGQRSHARAARYIRILALQAAMAAASGIAAKADRLKGNSRPAVTEDEQKRQAFGWKGVEEQVAAGLILMGACGIGFIAFTVPQRLDLILEKINAMSQRVTVLEGRVDQVENNVNDLKLKTRHVWR